jgi:regulator of sirC expression with transglutaminase-like and TPR domain
MAVAARVGLRMEPLNLPAHLMLRPVVAPQGGSSASALSDDDRPPPASQQQQQQQQQQDDDTDAAAEGAEGAADPGGLLVDAFNGGELCWLADAESRLSSIMGAQVVLDPRWASADTPAMSGGSFLLRWLNNLRQVYILNNRADSALAVLRCALCFFLCCGGRL